MTIPQEEGSLLHAPSDEKYGSISRQPSSYNPFDTYDLEKEKQYQQQFSDMYFLRLAKLKPVVERVAAEAWDGFQIAGEEVQKAERVLDVTQGSLFWVVGTIYMDLLRKPNILDDISKDHWITASQPHDKYISPSGGDVIMLEDESGRLVLVGTQLSDEMLVTGCIVAVMGTENANGEFEIVDIKVPDLPPQHPRWHAADLLATNGSRKVKKQEDDDEDMDEPFTGGGTKIAIVSGLSFSSKNSEHSLEFSLLIEYLLGEAFDPKTQESLSRISRLIIAGNSVAPYTEADLHDTIGNAKKAASKKYGYDSSAYNPTPTAHLDNFLASLLPTIPVTLIPGRTDPANVSFPQQPLHSAIFPRARAYGAIPASAGEEKQCGWLDTVTNPWDGEIEGWKVLGTGGQNLDDVYKYLESEDRLRMMEAMCRWRCCAPTAPDTLWSYPFQDDDPFVMDSCPHLFFVGSQPKFDTASIVGPEGQTVRLIAVPRFKDTAEIVLVDSETLEASVVKFAVS